MTVADVPGSEKEQSGIRIRGVLGRIQKKTAAGEARP
jgi:hypothetical protein